jgi:hypothetical protein
MSRIAIVIGVNRPKSPAPLKGAASDARAFAAWIGRPEQGFEVRPFIDDAAPVTFAGIIDEIERIVKAATYSQVVIYFAGHGFQNGGSEVWLLSGAPDRANEAISVEASVMAARESGLRSVVFISDACRSIPARMQDSRVDGASIFPNLGLKRITRPEIDRVFATLPSLVAVETAKADDDARGGGVFTREFMQGYLDTPSQFVDKILENGELIEVVTNRKLKELICEPVENAASDEIPKAGQTPEFILESVQAYVGRVERKKISFRKLGADGVPLDRLGEEIGKILKDFDLWRTGRDVHPLEGKRPQRREPAPPSVTTLAREAIELASNGASAQDAAAAVRGASHGEQISNAIERYSVPASVDHFETETGFVITGAAVVRPISPNFPCETEGTQLVRVLHDHSPGVAVPSTSVLLEFGGGSGAVLPGLRGYIAHVFVDGGKVTNVNYVPSTNSQRWNDYQYVQKDVEALRATVAAAANLGVFRVAPQEAEAFAEKVRRLKVFDPALGLYAAYAYASAGIDAEVQSVLHYMRKDLNAELFDVGMLARRDVRPREAGATSATELPILPFCPMLRQGWSLLAVRGAQLPEAASRTRDWLLPGLWSTFAPEGVKLLRDAIERGDFR